MGISRQPTIQSETVLETRQDSTNIWEAEAGRSSHSRLDTYQDLVSKTKLLGEEAHICNSNVPKAEAGGWPYT